jgi:hypothetical protein
MSYVSDDGTYGELIWNSRDGVTPFCVTSRDGQHKMTHVDWGLDVRAPDFRPPPGFRYFVDMDEEMAREAAIESVDRYWDHPEYPLSERYPDQEAAIQMFVQEYLGGVTVREAPARPPVKKGPFA